MLAWEHSKKLHKYLLLQDSRTILSCILPTLKTGLFIFTVCVKVFCPPVCQSRWHSSRGLRGAQRHLAMLGDDISGSNGLRKAGEVLSGEGLAPHNFLFENTAWVIMSKQSKSSNGEPAKSPVGRSCFNNTFDRWLFLKSQLFSSNYRSLHKHKNFTVPKI